MPESEALHASHRLEYPYSRSVGPVIGAFLTGLRDGKLLGVQGAGGSVIVPPTEYDPTTGEDTGEMVEVGPGGAVESWAWVSQPLPKHPLHRPRSPGRSSVWTGPTPPCSTWSTAAARTSWPRGDRVTVRFRPAAERIGAMADIEAFVPEGRSGLMTDETATDDRGPVTTLATPIRLDFDFTPGVAQSRFLRGLEQGKFMGQRCSVCGKVYVPSRGSCPTDGVPTTEDVELANVGTITTYCVVNVPFAGQSIEIPYICAQVLLDGANLSFMGLIQEIPTDQIRMGMRVEAVWVDPDELTPSLASVKYFRPNGEPDADYETYKEYL